MRKVKYIVFRMLSIFWVAVLALFANKAYTASPENLDDLVARWVNLASQESNIQIAWDERKAILGQQIELMKIEKDTLQSILDNQQGIRGKVEQERIKLTEEQNRVEKEQQALKKDIKQSLLKLNVLTNQLPPPLASSWEKKLLQIGQETMSSSEVLEGKVALLSELKRFETRMSVHETAISITPKKEAAETDVVVKQIYLGLSHAWYSSSNGKYYGYGSPTKDGWRWWSHDEAKAELDMKLDAKVILSMLAIIENPAQVALVSPSIVLQNMSNISTNASEVK